MTSTTVLVYCSFCQEETSPFRDIIISQLKGSSEKISHSIGAYD